MCSRAGDEIHIRASARAFLHRQVRSMVGSLEHVGSGKWRADDLKAALNVLRPGALRTGRAGGGALFDRRGLLKLETAYSAAWTRALHGFGKPSFRSGFEASRTRLRPGSMIRSLAL